MRRALLWLAVLAAVAVIGVAVYMRLISHDPAVWHVDPATAERTGKPNDYLVAPAGSTVSPTDRNFEPRPIAAKEMLFLFDSIAMNARRVSKVAEDTEKMHITYVQTSRIFGFPDYVSVKALDTGEGAALIIWSRSRFGYSDMGANRARIDLWLEQLGP